MSEPTYTTLALDSNGDLAVPLRWATAREAVALRLWHRLRTFRSEWFLDQRIGVPYYRDVLIKNPDINLITTLFRDVLLKTPGVEEIVAFNLELDKQTRILDLSFEVKTTGGTVFRSQPDEFILDY